MNPQPARSDAGTAALASVSLERPIVIIGAGPAGLTAAYELTRRRVPTVVFEADGQVGGLARTIEYKGFRFDIGGHRFYTKVPSVRAVWHELLGEDLLRRPRLSRIYYRGRYFDYPLRAGNVIANLGIATSVVLVASYLRACIAPIRPERSFEDWVINRFGRRLYSMFFRSYTEKVWGIPCGAIGAQWAAQRIRGLSLRTALVSMLRPARTGAIRTLIHEFEYPRLGPGMMWEACRDRIEAGGNRIELGTRVTALEHDGIVVNAVVIDRDGTPRRQDVSHVISTMPINHLVKALVPAPPSAVRTAADQLHYRDFLVVGLVVLAPHLFPDNWIYVHDPGVRVGRIQNFKNWSPQLVPDPSVTLLGLEYFCSAGDDLWSLTDDQLVALAEREARAIGLLDGARIGDATVLRIRHAYPVYDAGYAAAVETVRGWTSRLSNLQLVGRNGMHKYNNQDHSMLTAQLAVHNLFGAGHDLWAVNADEEYQEEENLRALAATQPRVPRRLTTPMEGS